MSVARTNVGDRGRLAADCPGLWFDSNCTHYCAADSDGGDLNPGEMVHSPVSATYVANLAPAHLRGRYQETWGLTWSAGLIMGPALGTLLFSWNAGALWL